MPEREVVLRGSRIEQGSRRTNLRHLTGERRGRRDKQRKGIHSAPSVASCKICLVRPFACGYVALEGSRSYPSTRYCSEQLPLLQRLPPGRIERAQRQDLQQRQARELRIARQPRQQQRARQRIV